jgi:hypothetical protein
VLDAAIFGAVALPRCATSWSAALGWCAIASTRTSRTRSAAYRSTLATTGRDLMKLFDLIRAIRRW